MRWRFLTTALLMGLLLAGCSTTSQRAIDGEVPVNRAAAEIPEAQLLDVWIELFDPGTLPERFVSGQHHGRRQTV